MLERFNFQEELGCDRLTYVHKALVSSDPLSSTNYVLNLIQGYPHTFSFWRPESKSFTSMVMTTIPVCAYSDITGHDGYFYGVNFMGDIVIFDFRSSQKDYYPTIAARVITSHLPREVACSNIAYIVHSMGELLVINRDGAYSKGGDDTYGVEQFHVYKIVDNSYHDVKDLGNRALFVGFSATLVVEPASQISGCKENHIYFTDDCDRAYYCIDRDGGKDKGIHNMLDGIILPNYTGLAKSLRLFGFSAI